MKENYLTIKKDGSYTEIIKKSEFICSIKRTNSEQEANDFIEEISRKHSKATHNCYAYLLGMRDEIQRASDNGEPSGTAGVPILNALKQNKIHNITAVVTRYFGGIKLGTGGLIRAYNGTTANAIKQIGIVNHVVMNQVSFNLSYADFEKAKYFLEQHQIPIDNVSYAENVVVSILLSKNNINEFHQQFKEYFNKPIELRIGKESYADVEVK